MATERWPMPQDAALAALSKAVVEALTGGVVKHASLTPLNSARSKGCCADRRQTHAPINNCPRRMPPVPVLQPSKDSLSALNRRRHQPRTRPASHRVPQ